MLNDTRAEMIREATRRNRQEIESALRENGVELRGKECRCPFHDDGTPSAGIFEGKDGVWRFRCQSAACGWSGDVFDLRSKLEHKELREVLPKGDRETSRPAGGDGASESAKSWPPAGETVKAERTWATLGELAKSYEHVVSVDPYTDPATGKPDYATIRIEPPGAKKEFRQAHPRPDGRWLARKPDGRLLPLFNRTRLKAATDILVVEGENCVKAVTPLLGPSWAATTSPGGAGKGRAAEADWTPLAGKRVYLWPDCDPADPKTGERAGLRHMEDVAALLAKLPTPPADLFWIDPDTLALPPKGDVEDFIAKLAGKPAVEQETALATVFAAATPKCPSAPLLDHIDLIASGKLAPAPLPWPGLHRLTQALGPGTVTVLCGAGGTAKSFWALQVLAHLTDKGIPAEYLALERSQEFHMLRLLSILDGRPDLLSADWVMANATEAKNAYARNRPALDKLAPRVTAEPAATFTRADALKWLEAACGRGCRVAMIDPVTALDGGGDIWTADLSLMMGARAILNRTGASLVCVTHPKKTGSNKAATATDDVAGGAAWARFCDSLLWVRRPASGGGFERATVRRLSGPATGMRNSDSYNRIVHMAKTRDGAGDGDEIAYRFGGASLTFHEVGLVIGSGGGSSPSAAGVSEKPIED
jgi:hypothetical protein